MIIMFILTALFSFLGAFYIIQSFFKLLYRQKNTCCKPILMWQICSNNSSDLETDVKFALSSLKWFNLRDFHKVCFVKCGLEGCDVDVCEALISTHNFEIIDSCNINNIL